MTELAERLARVRARIAAAARDAGRDPTSIALIAVSKRMPAAAIREAYECGQRDFGENYVQELKAKASELRDLPELRLHLIGHLQTNKVKAIVGEVAMIQSVDSLRLVEELDRRVATAPLGARAWPMAGVWGSAQTEFRGKPGALPVLVEVNLGGEAQKSGATSDRVAPILSAIDASSRLLACGLMVVPPFSDDPRDARPYFDQLRQLRDALGGVSRLPELSMGMTLDLEEAISAGATVVRVGTAIFGERTATRVG